MEAIWRKDWIHEFETPWSIFEKLSLANRVSREDILKFFGSEEVKKIKNQIIGNKNKELFYLNGFDEFMMNQIFDVNIKEIRQNTIQLLTGPLRNQRLPDSSWFFQHIRWCPECISTGYHSWLHQFKLLDKCAYHNCRLQSNCPICDKQLPFIYSSRYFGSPFECKCGFKFANFIITLWETWGERHKLTDPATILWLETTRLNKDTKYLFSPNNGKIDMLVDCNPYTAKKQFGVDENLISNDDFFYSSHFNRELYLQSIDTFHTIDRHIRKNILQAHSQCINQIWHLRKNEGEEFPEICPYAYAYVNWRRTLLETEHFYRTFTKGNDISRSGGKYGYELITNAITDDIKTLLEEFVLSSKERRINKNALQWIQDQWVYRFSLLLFNNCLKYANEILQNGNKHTSWDKILMLTKKNFRIVFKHYEQHNRRSNITVEMYFENTENFEITQHICPNKSIRKRRAISKMKTFIPSRIAMDYPDDLILRNYVNSFIRKHGY